MLTHATLSCKAQYHGLKEGFPGSVDWLENGIKQHFANGAQKLYEIATRLRRRTYTLARASESEIIARLKRGRVTASVTHADLHAQTIRPAAAGGNLRHRVQLYCDRLRRRVVSYAQACALNAKDESDFCRDVLASYPHARRVRLPRRILKPKLMEAQYDIGTDEEPASVSADMTDEQAWYDMLDAYKKDYVPQWRGPEYIADVPAGVDPDEAQYAWEYERDLTQEFVQSVRDGQIDAAKTNGITDFVWIAVIDDRTDSCCSWRDGLLVSEIEKQMSDHEGDDENCNLDGDGTAPPIHFNCRCTLAPATDEMPEKADDGADEFDDWLNS